MPLNPYFEDIQSHIIGVLSNANNSIKAAIAWFTDPRIINVLIHLSSKGILIELIINDDDINKSRKSELQELQTSGAKIYYHTVEHDLMHHKFCLIDDEVLIMGSYNWTNAAAHNNHESIVIVKNEPETIADFCDEFASLKKNLGITESGLPVVHNDVLELKTQVYVLENEIAALEVQKAEMGKVIFDFETQLKIEVGYLIQEKLMLEKKIQELKANLTKKQDDYEVLQQKQDYLNAFEQAWYEARSRIDNTLSEADESNMKKIYRDAMMMIHPDRYMNEPEKQDEANRLSAILTEAYKNKDFKKVQELWKMVKDGLAFRSDWFNSKDQSFFKKLLSLLSNKKQQLELEITQLEMHKVWTVRKENEDYTAYFEQLKNTLQSNISILKNEILKYQ
jgi:hypothetical protein